MSILASLGVFAVKQLKFFQESVIGIKGLYTKSFISWKLK
jgi:hypothetical protein